MKHTIFLLFTAISAFGAANPPMDGRVSGGRGMSSNDVYNIITNVIPSGGATGMKTNQFTTNTIGAPVVGTVNFAGVVVATNTLNNIVANTFTGTNFNAYGIFTGDGSGLTNVTAAALSKNSKGIFLSEETSSWTVDGDLVGDGSGNLTNWNGVYATSFSGSGASLTSLNASQLTSGTLPDARLSTSVLTNGDTRPWTNFSQVISTQLVANSWSALSNSSVNIKNGSDTVTLNGNGGLGTVSDFIVTIGGNQNMRVGSASVRINDELRFTTSAGTADGFITRLSAGNLRVGTNLFVRDKIASTNTMSAYVVNTTNPGFRSTGTNNMVLTCPDGGTWLLRVDNLGVLTTVTNTAGL